MCYISYIKDVPIKDAYRATDKRVYWPSTADRTHHWYEDELAAEADDEGHGILELLLEAVHVGDTPDSETDENGHGGTGAVEDEVSHPSLSPDRHGDGLHQVGPLDVQHAAVHVEQRNRHRHAADVHRLDGEVVVALGTDGHYGVSLPPFHRMRVMSRGRAGHGHLRVARHHQEPVLGTLRGGQQVLGGSVGPRGREVWCSR